MSAVTLRNVLSDSKMVGTAKTASAGLANLFESFSLGNTNYNETERTEKFWNRSTIAMKATIEQTWLNAVWNSDEKPNYGMQNLDAY